MCRIDLGRSGQIVPDMVSGYLGNLKMEPSTRARVLDKTWVYPSLDNSLDKTLSE